MVQLGSNVTFWIVLKISDKMVSFWFLLDINGSLGLTVLDIGEY